MTEQAPPDYYFQNIIFNPKYYDNEVNNNITKYEADNKYIKYNSSNLQLTKTESELTTTINDLRLTSIGRVNNLFILPTNTSTATPYSRLVLIDNTTRNTTWFPSSGNVGYNSITSILTTENNTGAIPDITDLVMSGSIGSSSAEKFVLPSNSSTSTVGQVLSISNATSKTTQWISIPNQISDYVRYTPSTYELSRVLNGTPTTITSLTVNSALGRSTTQRFSLPANCSTAPAGAVLSILTASATAPSTQWISLPSAINDYTNYNNTNKTLISNVSGTPTTITDLVMSSSVGSSTAEKFVLPSNSSTSTVGQVLSISNATSKTTQWISIPTQITEYVQYNTSTNKISNIDSTGTTIINDLVLSNKIGSLKNQMFKLPTNISSSFIGATIRILDNTTDPITTEWETTPPAFNPYVSYNSTSKQLEDNGALGSSNITDLVVSSSIGSSTAQKFVLPSNSSTSTAGQVLSILNATSKTTQWITIPTQITDYVRFNPTTNDLSRVLNGSASTITLLTVSTLGSNTSQRFALPTNSSTAPADYVLSINVAAINNGGAPSTIWKTIPTQISSYVNYNNANSNLISNVNGTPTTITSISISGLLTTGNINSGAINANANLIETTGNLQSRGLVIKNASNVNVATISISGEYTGSSYIYTSYGNIETANGNILTQNGNLQSRGLIIKNTSDVNVATISNLGALVCTSIQNNNNTVNCGNITSGTINSGAINANANLIETTGGLKSRALTIQNTSSVNVATISNLGELVCTSIQNNNNTVNCGNITSGIINSGAINANANLIETTGNLQSRGLIIKNTSNVNVATISISGEYTGSSYIYTSYGNIETANGNILTQNGNLQSRGLIIKNTSDVNVATISNLGALVCTTIQNNGNTLNCGDITSGAINAGSGLIQTTGILQSRGLIINNPSNQGVGAFNEYGELFCTTFQNNGNTNICNLASNYQINIGNASSTQQLNINRPIRMPGNLPFTNGLEIGYALNTGVFFSSTNIPNNAPVPNVRSDTPIPSGNLVNGAVYLMTYTILIVPQATLDLSKFQYGIFSGSTFMSGFNQNHSMITTTNIPMRFNTSETYSYSGSGHFVYSSGVTYNLSFIMAFLSTAPTVQTNVELIRIR